MNLEKRKKISYELGINYIDYNNGIELTVDDSKTGCDVCIIF